MQHQFHIVVFILFVIRLYIQQKSYFEYNNLKMIQDEYLIKSFIQKISRIGLEEVDTSLNKDDQFTNSLIFNLKNGGPAGIMHLGSMSWVLKRPIEIFDSSNNLILRVDYMTDCIPIKMQYHSLAQIGHWTLINSQECDIDGRIYGNCFFDVISTQVNISSKKLREKLLERMTQVRSQLIKNKFIIKQIYQINKDFLMVGAGLKLIAEKGQDKIQFLKILREIQPSASLNQENSIILLENNGQNMLSKIISHQIKIPIMITNKFATHWKKSQQAIYVNFDSDVKIKYKKEGQKKKCPLDITLYHELCHCWRYLEKISWANNEGSRTDQIYFYFNPINSRYQAVAAEEAETVGFINKHIYSQNQYRERKLALTKNQEYLPRKYYGYDLKLQQQLIIEVALALINHQKQSWKKILKILQDQIQGKNLTYGDYSDCFNKNIQNLQIFYKWIYQNIIKFEGEKKVKFIDFLKLSKQDVSFVDKVKDITIKKKGNIGNIQYNLQKYLFADSTEINLEEQTLKEYVKKTTYIIANINDRSANNLFAFIK